MWLTVKQVSAELNVSDGCIYRLVAEGTLDHIRVGCGRGTIRIRKASVDNYVTPTKPCERRRASNRGRRAFQHLDSDRLLSAWNQKEQ
jgi:excisionase family DNA binding protein